MTDSKFEIASEKKRESSIVSEEASLKLSLAGNLTDKVKLTDAAKPTEIDVKEKTQEIFGRITTAKQSADALAELIVSNKQIDEKLTFTGADGKPHQTTVGERVKELKQTVNDAANQAVVMSKSIDQSEVSRQLNNSLAERNTIAKGLGLDTNKLSTESIAEALKTAGDATKTKLESLLAAQGKVDDYKTLENAPAFTKLIYAQLKGGGFTNPNTAVEMLPNGKLKVDRADITDAMSLIAEAGGSSKELRNHPLYLNAVNEVFPRNENSSQKVQSITQDLQQAIELGSKGNKVEQEKVLQAAVAQADSINVSLIAQMVKDPNFANRQSPEVLKEMANTVVMAETARLQYAQFLAEQGRFGDAQKLTLRVKAECPDVMYNRGEDGQIHYNDNRFVDLAKLDKQMASSSTFDPNKLNSDITNFRDQFKNLQGMATDANSESRRSTADKTANNTKIQGDLAALSASMDGQLATQKRELTQTRQALRTERVKLEAEQKSLGSKTFVTEEAGRIEAKRIEDQIKILDLQKDQIVDQLKANTQNTQLVRLLQASYDISREDRFAANAKLDQIELGDPTFIAKYRQDLDKMREMSQEPGWWDSWGKKLCIVGAVVVGVAAGIWMGPGCIASGIAAGTAMAGAVGAGAVGTTILVTAGAVGGATVVGLTAGAGSGLFTYGARRLADNTGGVTQYKDEDGKLKPLFTQQTAWQDAGDAFRTAGSAAMFTALPGAAGGIAKATTVAGDTAVVAGTVGRLAHAAPKMVTFGTAMTGGQTAIDFASGHGSEVTLKGFAGQVALNSFLGMGGSVKEAGFTAKVLSPFMSAKRFDAAVGGAGYVAITQAMAVYTDSNGVQQSGAHYNGFRESSSVLGPWGYTPHEVNKSLYQVTQVKGTMSKLDGGAAYYMTKPSHGASVIGNNSVFDSAVRYSAEQNIGGR